MPSLLIAHRRARPRAPYPVPLRGALATDARFIVGLRGTQAAPDQVAYLTLHPDGSASLEREDVVNDGFGLPWSFEDDGTLRIPIGRAPMELDVHAVRQALRPGMLLGESLRIIRRDRRVIASANGATTIQTSAEGLTACAHAALWTDTMVQQAAFSTGRCVRFADEVLSRTMFRLPDLITPSALTVLTVKTEQRYARAGTRLLGVLPWLQAQVAPQPVNTRTLEPSS